MNIIDLQSHSKVYLIGDIHGGFRKLQNTLSADKNRFQDSVIFIAGDIGFGFSRNDVYEQVLGDINHCMSEINAYVLLIRGNHDDPSYFEEDKFGFTNVKILSDYTVVKTGILTTICIGGGISIDRIMRHQGSTWWIDETVEYDEKEIDEITANGIVIDSVLTHTYPRVSEVKGNDKVLADWMIYDKYLEEDLKKEGEEMINIQKKLESLNHIKIWMFGHLHISQLFVNGNTVYVQADCAFTVYDINDALKLKDKQLLINWEENNEDKK